MKMYNAQQHWKILRKLGTDLANSVRSYMVIGNDGEGLLVATEDGDGFWLGTIKFESGESKTVTQPTSLDVSDLVSMAQGSYHILLLNKQGEIYSMGTNDCGQLGLGTKDQQTRFSPQLIPSPHKFISIRCGRRHSLALTEDGKVWAWGLNDFGQVGMPNSTDSVSSPRQIPELDPHRVVAVEYGAFHSLALTDRGDVYGWGNNELGQFGVGSEIYKRIPTRIVSPSPVRSMAAGSYHTLLLTQTGEVYACGQMESINFSSRLFKVEGLPHISQIASHPATNLSIAMSFDQRCFVWGELCDLKSISTPRELPLFYSTVESSLSCYSTHRNTSHSVKISVTPPSLSTRMSRMFDNPETGDVQFLVEEKTIYAHRIILSNSSDYFGRMFSETWLPQVDPEDPIVKVTIPDQSYEVFHTFLHLFYTDSLEVNPDLLPDLFELATQYLVPDLQQLCLSRMRTTLSPATCCLYYPLTWRYSLPELSVFQQELVQFIFTRILEVYRTAAYQSMDADICKKLSIAMANLNNC